MALGACIAVWAGGGAVADAQQRWLVVTTGTDESAGEARAAAASETLQGEGRRLVEGGEAVGRIEERISRPFEPAPAQLRDELGTAAESALEHVARGNDDEVLSMARPLLDRARRHLAALGRDAQAARDLGNLCLYVVRAHHHAGDATAAARTARECLRLVPDVEADRSLHPPEVRQALRRARDDIDNSPDNVLSIQAAPGEPEGCTVRINGRPLGETPSVRMRLAPGLYTVQAECDESEPGRVRRVDTTGGEATRRVVRPTLSGALRTGAGVQLVYPDAETQSARLPTHLGRVAKAVGASRLLVVPSGDGALAVWRLTRTVTAERQRELAPESAGERGVRDAVAALLHGEADAAGSPEASGGAELAAQTDGDGGPPILGPVLLGVAGVGGLTAAGIGLFGDGCDEKGPGTSGCVKRRATSTAAVAVYGSLGVAAIGGAVLWMVLGSDGDGDEHAAEPGDTNVALGPGTIQLDVAF